MCAHMCPNLLLTLHESPGFRGHPFSFLLPCFFIQERILFMIPECLTSSVDSKREVLYHLFSRQWCRRASGFSNKYWYGNDFKMKLLQMKNRNGTWARRPIAICLGHWLTSLTPLFCLSFPGHLGRGRHWRACEWVPGTWKLASRGNAVF